MSKESSSPIALQEFHALDLKNKLVMAPMTRCQSDAMGRPTQPLADYYIRRAREGVGLIIVESCAINDTDALTYENGCRMSQGFHAEAWQPIIKQIHEFGAKVWVQLFHGGRLTVPEISKCTPIAPSPIKPEGETSFWRPCFGDQLVHFQSRTPFVVPREMSHYDIDRILSEFEFACELAISAGFDGIELHGAHGYLIHEFCNQFSNHRKDDYGFNGEFLFCTRLVESCRSYIPREKVLSYRLSKHMIDNYYLNIAGMHLDELIPKLELSGVDVFHSSELQVGESIDRSGLSLGEAIRNFTHKPIIGCGGIQSIDQANEIMQKNGCYELLALGRTLIIDPRIPQTPLVNKFSYEKYFERLT